MLQRVIGKAIRYGIRRKRGVIVYYKDAERSKVFDLITQIKRETNMLLTDNEAYQIFMGVTRTQKVPGDVAEVGAYRGGSGKLICEAKGDRAFHMFDTFEGIPRVDEIDAHLFRAGDFAASVEEVSAYLSRYKDVHIYKGFFPATAGPVEDKTFSFVHLDVDTYESTRDCLHFFYPRLNPGGVIISHDYTGVRGVKKAFDEFFDARPEPIIELSGSQCLVVKM
jgi:predicted O-methyltransferase YrrM